MQIVFVSVLRANTLYPPSSCFLVLNVEKFRVRYRYGFPAAEETRHRVCPVSLPLCLVSSAAGKPYLYLTRPDLSIPLSTINSRLQHETLGSESVIIAHKERLWAV